MDVNWPSRAGNLHWHCPNWHGPGPARVVPGPDLAQVQLPNGPEPGSYIAAQGPSPSFGMAHTGRPSPAPQTTDPPLQRLKESLGGFLQFFFAKKPQQLPQRLK